MATFALEHFNNYLTLNRIYFERDFIYGFTHLQTQFLDGEFPFFDVFVSQQAEENDVQIRLYGLGTVAEPDMNFLKLINNLNFKYGYGTLCIEQDGAISFVKNLSVISNHGEEIYKNVKTVVKNAREIYTEIYENYY